MSEEMSLLRRISWSDGRCCYTTTGGEKLELPIAVSRMLELSLQLRSEAHQQLRSLNKGGGVWADGYYYYTAPEDGGRVKVPIETWRLWETSEQLRAEVQQQLRSLDEREKRKTMK